MHPTNLNYDNITKIICNEISILVQAEELLEMVYNDISGLYGIGGGTKISKETSKKITNYFETINSIK